MNYYVLIEKENGKLHQPFIFFTEEEKRPINEVELEYAKVTTEMAECFETHERVVDWTATTYINGVWNVKIDTPVKVTNYLATRNADRNKFLAAANTKLNLPDASSSFKTAVNNYITQLNALQFSNNEIQQINWPIKPW
jgi:hypothetical protein